MQVSKRQLIIQILRSGFDLLFVFSWLVGAAYVFPPFLTELALAPISNYWIALFVQVVSPIFIVATLIMIIMFCLVNGIPSNLVFNCFKKSVK